MTEKSLVSLAGQKSSLLLQIDGGAELLYWGKKLDGPTAQQAAALQRAVPYGRLDCDVPLTLMPENGRGLFSSPGLEGHRQGKQWSAVFSVEKIERQQDGVIIYSADAAAGLSLKITLKLDARSDVIQLCHTLTNNHQQSYSLNRFAVTLSVPERAAECLSFYGRWVKEFQQQRQLIQHGGYQQENRRGRTSHEHFPALVVGTPAFGETDGEVWGVHLAWSGNHRLRVDVKADGRRFIQAEALYYPGEIELAQDESISTPWLYASYSASGLNAMSQQFHRYVREHILRFSAAEPVRPVHLNTWEGIYFDHQPEYIMQMASEAAKMGVERFIIDDGWFRGRNNDRAALGDWYLDEQKYPQGLEPVIDHVLAQGMTFGLWVEPEMISKDSDLYRQHPDWLLQLAEYQQPTGRHQYVLDLSRPEVFEWLFARLDSLLTRYQISYLKWDMNREVVQPGHYGRAAQTRQVEQVYRLIDRLRASHPQVEIESCAAGGGRIDYEVLKRTQRVWPSDNNDALERQIIQRGFSYFFPPEIMGAHIGARHSHSTRRVADIHFRGISALFGHMGIELDPVKEGAAEKAGFSKYIALHKRYRTLIHSGDLFRLPSDDAAAQVISAIVAQDKRQALVSVAQIAMPTWALSGALRVAGLLPQQRYRISLLDCADNFLQGIVNTQPAWVYSGAELTGEWLAHVGLAMPVLDPESALLLLIEATDDCRSQQGENA